MFAEKIEIFSAVEFSKLSILTGIIKITLKVLRTLLADKNIKMPRKFHSLPECYGKIRLFEHAYELLQQFGESAKSRVCYASE